MAFTNFLQTGGLRRNLIPAAVAVVLGGVAWVGIGPLLSGDDDEEEAPEPEVVEVVQTVAPAPTESPASDRHPPEVVHPSVLVANRAIPSGVLLTTEFVEWREWQGPVDVNMAVVQDVVPLRAVIGSVTRRRFQEGDMIAWDGILVPGHPGFISAVLTPGMVAVTVEVDRPTTVANIIYPGDRVDVIMVTSSTAEGSGGPASRTIVRHCRVLAVGSSVLALGRYGSVSLTQAGQLQPVERPAGENYTLEVLPTDAERVHLAASVGRLTLAMRPIHAQAASASEGEPVRLGEVMPVPEGPAPSVPVRIIRGAQAAVDWKEEDA